MEPRSALAALVDDRSHGAAEIAQRARRHLARLADEPGDEAGPAAREAVLALLEAHPSMAPIVHLADETLTRLERDGPDGLRELPRDTPPSERVADRAAEAILEAGTVLTYSRSGTVLAALEVALGDAEVRVLTSEARPGEEGLTVARELAEAGADVELTYDAHLPTLADEAALVLVGADAVTADAFVNKTGTRSLLQAAQRAGTPAHALASTGKLWPARLPRGPLSDVQADWQPDVPATVRVRAPLFERVPLELVDEIVTEEGNLRPGELARRVEGIDVHEAVVDALR